MPWADLASYFQDITLSKEAFQFFELFLDSSFLLQHIMSTEFSQTFCAFEIMSPYQFEHNINFPVASLNTSSRSQIPLLSVTRLYLHTSTQLQPLDPYFSPTCIPPPHLLSASPTWCITYHILSDLSILHLPCGTTDYEKQGLFYTIVSPMSSIIVLDKSQTINTYSPQICLLWIDYGMEDMLSAENVTIRKQDQSLVYWV